MTAELCALEEIMLREGDLDLFPPEVVALFKEPSTGPLRAHRRFATAVRDTPDADRRARRAHWLDDLRLWAVPTENPALLSFAGVGAWLRGEEQPDPQDGSYLATQTLYVAGIPLVGLNRYWVVPRPDHLEFRARVPLHVPLWRLAALPLVLVAVPFVLILLLVLWNTQWSTLVIYNGTESPVTVEAGEHTWEIAPGSHVTASVSAVPLSATSTAEGGWTETVELPLPEARGGLDAVVYNVAGAGSLEVSYVAYGRARVPDAVPISEVVQVVDNLDHMFEHPPDTAPEGDSVRGVLGRRAD